MTNSLAYSNPTYSCDCHRNKECAMFCSQNSSLNEETVKLQIVNREFLGYVSVVQIVPVKTWNNLCSVICL